MKAADSVRIDPLTRFPGQSVPTVSGARSIARLAIIYLHQKMKTPRKGAPLILNIEMNITKTGINPKTADELHR
ncbi:hypothetical protein C7S14_2921 [Burkholderia cepacia]|nr:hypothetical protein C7S14_2921 [Burkholderia cepacia]